MGAEGEATPPHALGAPAPWPGWASAALGVVLLVLLAQLLLTRSGPYDEAAELAASWRMLQGERLYVEVWEFAAPLPHLMAWAVFKLLGHPWLEPLRFLAWVFSGALVVACARLAWRLGSGPVLAVAVGVGVAFASLPVMRAYYHHWLSSPLLALALLLAVRAMGAQGLAWPAWAAAGLAVGLASACTQSLLPLGLAAVGVGLVATTWAQGLGWGGLLKRSVAFVLAALAPWVALVAGFAWHGAAGAMLRQVWWWPWFHYREPGSANDVAWFSDAEVFFPMWVHAMSPSAWGMWLTTGLGTALLPWLAALGGLLVGGGLLWAWARGGRVPSGRGQVALMFSAALVLVWLHLMVGRPDLVHGRMAAPLAFVAWAAWAGHLGRQAQGAGGIAMRVPAVALVLFVAMATTVAFRQDRKAWQAGLMGWGLTAAYRDSEAMRTLRGLLPPGGRVVTYPGSGVPLLYGGGRAGTRYTTLTLPSFRYHGPEDYQAFRADWRAHPPDVVILAGRDRAQAEVEWGGEPTLAGYRKVAEAQGPPCEVVARYGFWARAEAGASGGLRP